MTTSCVATRFAICFSFSFLFSACHPAPPPVLLASSRFMTSTTNAVPVRVDMPVANAVSLYAEPGSYVVVARVTNRLQVVVMYPSSPSSQKPYTGTAEERTILYLPGVNESGGVYAVASDRPFDFSRVASGDQWPKPITKYQSVSEAVVIPKYAQKLDVVAGRFFEDITSTSSRLGFDGQLYGTTGPLQVNALPRRHDCRKADSRDPCPVN